MHILIEKLQWALHMNFVGLPRLSGIQEVMAKDIFAHTGQKDTKARYLLLIMNSLTVILLLL